MVQYLPDDHGVFDTSDDVQGRTNAVGAWMRRNGHLRATTASPAGLSKGIYGFSAGAGYAIFTSSYVSESRDIMKYELKYRVRKPEPDSDSLFASSKPLPPPAASYTISARCKSPDMPVLRFLREMYGYLPLREIDSLFGFVERSTLYGGRVFQGRELSDRDALQLTNAGIGLRLPMSNHHVSRDEYEANFPLLRKYHHPVNSIIATNDQLAIWIREDFPDYRIDASVIKNIKTYDKIEEALELYDSVVLPMRLNKDLEFLEKIRDKDKITLFANAGCALTCPSKLCYLSISEMNKGNGGEFNCALMYKEREVIGMVDFLLKPYMDLGFHRYKLLRPNPTGLTGF